MAVSAGPAYRFDVDYTRDDRHLRGDGGQVDALSLDLLDLATAAYLVDRSERRGAPWTAGWRRQLRFELRARRSDVWRRPEVRDAVLTLLHWLSEDEWQLVLSDKKDGEPPGQMALPVDAVDREVVLFSGGMDSTAGASLLLAAGKPVLAAAVATNERMLGYQAAVARALTEVPGWDLRTAPVRLSKRRAGRSEERTRRTRGFVFLAVGWAAAVRAGRPRLLVLENGVGAINLPCTAAQTGCMTSRGAHPRTLELAGRLFSLLHEQTFDIVNPHLAETKAQMMARVPELARPACSLSESCDNAAAGRGELAGRCGRCSSCILRRLSLRAAGRSEWDGRVYLADVAADGRRSDLPEMLWQAAKLAKACEATDPAAAMMQAFPQLKDLRPDVLTTSAIVDLYSTYVREWRRDPDPLVRRFLPELPMAA